MKFIILSIAVALAAFGIANASKRPSKSKPKPSVHGEWTGSFCMENGPFVNDISLKLDDNNSITVIEGDQYWGAVGKGEFKIVGDSLFAKYVHLEGIQSPLTLNAAINKETKVITGNWSWVKGQGKIKMRAVRGSEFKS